MPNSMRGRVGKCPGCQTTIEFPDRIFSPQEFSPNYPPIASGDGASHTGHAFSPNNGQPVPVYKKISRTFKIDKQKYFGTAIASADKIYLVTSHARNDLATGISGALGGAIGGLIVAALSKNPDSISSCNLKQIDQDVVNHPDWPLKVTPENEGQSVLIIPRDAVRNIKHPALTNLLNLQSYGVNISIEYSMFRGRSVQDYLVDTGWPVTWKGENVSGHALEEDFSLPGNETGSRTYFALAGVCLLLVVVASFFIFPVMFANRNPVAKRKNDAANGRIAVEPPPTVAPLVSTPMSIDDALDQLKTAGKLELQSACDYLANEANFDQKRRAEVCDALMTIPPSSAAISFEAASALRQWVNVETIPRLKREVLRSDSSRSSTPLLEMYARLAGVEAAPILVTRLNKGSKPLLEEIGPEAAKYVIPYMNSFTNSERSIARALLSQWDADGNLLIRQCLKDSASPHINTSRPARQFMVEFSGNIDGELQNEISQRFERLLFDPDCPDKRQVVVILGKYPGENTAKRLFEFMKSYKRSPNLDRVVVAALANLDSDIALEGVVFAFLDIRATSTSKEALLSKGSPLVARKLVEQFDDFPHRARSMAVSVFEKIEGGNSVLIEKCIQFLDSDDLEQINSAMKLLAKCKHDSSCQSKVAQALSNAIDFIPDTTDDSSLLRATCDASEIWGDGDVASRLVGFIDSPNSTISKRTQKAIGDMKEPVTYPVLVKQLFDKEKRNRAKTLFLRFGPSAEPALLAQIDNPALSDSKTSQIFYSLIGKIGGNKSLELLQKHVAETDNTTAEKTIKSAIRTIKRNQRKSSTKKQDR